MRMMNEAIEDARDFRGMMERLLAGTERVRDEIAARAESVQANPPTLGMERQPGENRAAHRARLKRERREANGSKVRA